MVFFLITSFVLQGTVFKSISFGDTVPNVLLIFVVSFALMRGEVTGLILGFFSGLLIDIFTGSAIGLYTLLYMYIGYGNGMLHKIFYPHDVKLPMGMIVVSDLVYDFMVYVLLFLLRGRLEFGLYFTHIILPECVYTILVTILFYPLFSKVNSLLENDEIRRAKKFVSKI